MNPEEVRDESAASSVSIQNVHPSVGRNGKCRPNPRDSFRIPDAGIWAAFRRARRTVIAGNQRVKDGGSPPAGFPGGVHQARGGSPIGPAKDGTQRAHANSRESVQGGQRGDRALERRLAQFDEQVSKDLRELRQLILERHRSLSDELTQSVGNRKCCRIAVWKSCGRTR